MRKGTPVVGELEEPRPRSPLGRVEARRRVSPVDVEVAVGPVLRDERGAVRPLQDGGAGGGAEAVVAVAADRPEADGEAANGA